MVSLPGLYDQLRKQLPELSLSLMSTLLNQLGIFLTVKLAVTLVSPAEYGTYALIAGAVALAMNLEFQPVLASKARDYFDQRGRRNEYLWKVMRLLLTIIAFNAVGVYLWFTFLQHESYFSALTFSAIAMFAAQPLFSGSILFCEINRKYLLSSAVNILSRAVQVACLALLLLTLGRTAASIALAQALGYFAGFFLLTVKRVKKTEPVPTTLNTFTGSKGLQFWLVWFNVGAWVLATSDRYLLGHYASLAEVGEYSINYGLWSIPFLGVGAWLESYFRPKLYSAAADNRLDQVRRLTYLRLSAATSLGLFFIAILYLVGPFVAFRILKGPYWSHLMPLLLTISTGHLFYLMANALTPVFLALKRGLLLVVGTVAAALVSVIANVIYIPRFHVMAAASVTLASYACWFALMLPLSLSVVRRCERRS